MTAPRPLTPLRRRALLASALAALALLSACAKTPPAKTAPPADPLGVKVPAELAPRLKLVTLIPQPITETLRVAGRLDFDELKLARIGAPVTGRVSRIDVTVGQQVAAGAVLAQLHSTELGQAQLAYLKTRSHRELTQRAYERAKVLHESDVIAAAELQRRENEYATAQAESRAAADQLKVLGMSGKAVEKLSATGAIESTSTAVASLAGSVVEKHVTQGQVVQPADVLFTVADLSRLWAIAEVPEQQAAHVRVGQTVDIEVPALDHARLSAKLIAISDTVNPDTRTVRVRTEVDNRDRRLKPAMLATMLIAGVPVSKLAVPASAVVRENNADHVFVQIGAEQFRLTAVTLGAEAGGLREVKQGLKEGEVIVGDGAFHLNNERKRKELEGG